MDCGKHRIDRILDSKSSLEFIENRTSLYVYTKYHKLSPHTLQKFLADRLCLRKRWAQNASNPATGDIHFPHFSWFPLRLTACNLILRDSREVLIYFKSASKTPQETLCLWLVVAKHVIQVDRTGRFPQVFALLVNRSFPTFQLNVIFSKKKQFNTWFWQIPIPKAKLYNIIVFFIS